MERILACKGNLCLEGNKNSALFFILGFANTFWGGIFADTFGGGLLTHLGGAIFADTFWGGLLLTHFGGGLLTHFGGDFC